jgi:hypothetical protein
MSAKITKSKSACPQLRRNPQSFNMPLVSKVKICPCAQLIKGYAMKMYGREDVQIHVFSTLALVGGEWSDIAPCRFNPGK